MTGAIHVIKLRRLWSKFADNLYPTNAAPLDPHDSTKKVLAGDLRKELEDWHAAIPCSLQTPTSNLQRSVYSSKAWFQLAYDHSILLLYRHYITLPPAPGESELVENAFEECAQRSREMCLLYRRLYQNSSIQFTWGSLHILFVGGLTYLYCLWKSKRVRQAARQSDVVNTCFSCNTVLVIIAERWSQATTYRDTFETLSEKTIQMICNEGVAQPEIPSEVHQLDPLFATPQPTISQDWLLGLENLPVPNESEWFVQELLQDMRDYQHPEITFDNLDDFTGR